MAGLPEKFDWDELLRAAAVLQGLLPDAVLVGGSAAALIADHRVSRDIDFTLDDLRSRFDALLEQLEARSDWVTARYRKPLLILRSLSGVETGLRQLRRIAPLETTTVATRWGPVRVPTPEELLRVKCWLALTRNQTRDYLDIVALAEILGDARSVAALSQFDDLYRDLYRVDAGRDVSPMLQLARQLADPSPEDHDWMDLGAYKGLRDPWRSWDCVRQACGRFSTGLIAARG